MLYLWVAYRHVRWKGKRARERERESERERKRERENKRHSDVTREKERARLIRSSHKLVGFAATAGVEMRLE